MKNLIRISIALIGLFSTVHLNAGDTPVLKNLKDGKTTVLTLNDVKEGDKLLVKDLFGQVLYHSTIHVSGKFEKGFNLTSLQNGEYYFELKKDSEIRRIPFLVRGHKIRPFKSKENEINQQFDKVELESDLIKEVPLTKKPIELEKGVRRNIPSFKGRDFVNYIKSNKLN